MNEMDEIERKLEAIRLQAYENAAERQSQLDAIGKLVGGIAAFGVGIMAGTLVIVILLWKGLCD